MLQLSLLLLFFHDYGVFVFRLSFSRWYHQNNICPHAPSRLHPPQQKHKCEHNAKAEAVFTVGEAFRGDHKAALAALKSTTTLQFEYLDALLRPGQSSTPSSLPAGSSSSRRHDSNGSNSSGGAGSRGVQGGEGKRGRGWGVATSSQAVDLPQQRAFAGLAAGLDDGDRSLHVRLLVRFRPHEVYSFLSTSTG